MRSLGCIAVIGCGTAADAGFANDWRAPFEVMKTQIETLYAPLEDYWSSDDDGVPHGCRPFVHIPDEPPKCFVTHFHGYTACPDDFLEFLPDLTAAGCLVVVPAWPGHGFKHGGGRPNLPGFRSADFPESSMAPEPEKYFQHIFDVAYILSDAGVGSLPNKMVVGHSLGGPAAAMFALCSDVQWDRVLVMNPAFKMAEPADQILFDLPYSTPLSFTSPIALDIPLVDVSACKDEDKVTSPGYCDFYTSSFVSIFQFGYVIMGFWEAVPLFRQGLVDEANEKIEEMMGHVLEMGGMGGSMRAWDGMDGHLQFAPAAKGQESSWDVREREHPGRQANFTALLRRRAQYVAESDGTNIQVVGCGAHGADLAVSKEGIQKFIELAGTGGREISFCSFPGGAAQTLPHAWSRPYTNPRRIFWWSQYVRVALTRFALHGENFQKMDAGSRTRDAPDICFVDQMADGDAENAAFLGLEYTARYPLFKKPALIEQWKEFSFSGLKCGPGLGCETHVWKMSRAAGLFGRQEVFAVQPLLARFANSSHPSAEPHDLVPILIERDEPEVWSQVLRRPIRAAWVKAPGGCKDAYFRDSHAPTMLEGSEENGVCLMVPLRRLMGNGDGAGTLAKSLVAGALYDASAGRKQVQQFCGKSSEVAVLKEHICLALLAGSSPAVV